MDFVYHIVTAFTTKHPYQRAAITGSNERKDRIRNKAFTFLDAVEQSQAICWSKFNLQSIVTPSSRYNEPLHIFKPNFNRNSLDIFWNTETG